MLLRSDNVAGVSPEILAAVSRVAEGDMAPYGEDPVTAELQARFAELFEHDCIVLPVSSGIAANALGLSLLAGPGEAVICHRSSHIAGSEAGSVELFSNGARLVAFDGPDGRLQADTVEQFLSQTDFARAAVMPPRALALTEVTELGTVYSPNAVHELTSVVRRFGLRTHTDGARFANALATIGCRPSDLTWRVGVDVLSFGATKNGAMFADAVVIFDKSLAPTLARRQRRSGQAMSKMRFLSAQLLAYLEDDLWLRNARQANDTARRLAGGLAQLPGFDLRHPVEANLIFVRIDVAIVKQLAAEGIVFRARDAMRPKDSEFRLVTSFATSEAEIERLLGACRMASRHASTKAAE
jgi:threonine aldolase